MNIETKTLYDKAWNEIQIERFNQRLIYIARIFSYDKFIGIDEKILQSNRYYFNDFFDYMYDLPLSKLEELDQESHANAFHYAEILRRRNTINGE